jgi:hypothetical protein
VKEPTANAMISQIAAVVMDGPTSYLYNKFIINFIKNFINLILNIHTINSLSNFIWDINTILTKSSSS